MVQRKRKNPEDIAFQKEFGEYIREGRERKHLYQNQVAEVLGVTQQYYSHIEKGVRNVDLIFALKICQTLNLNLDEFIAKHMN